MKLVNVSEVSADFARVLCRVTDDGESFALEENGRVVAWLTAAEQSAECSVENLEHLLSSLPRLADDLNDFARDVCETKTTPPLETSQWD